MIKKFVFMGAFIVLGFTVAWNSVQARPDISDIRSSRGVQDILCERLSSRWIISPTCQTSTPPAQPQCGNNIVESGEECDGNAPAGYTCSNQCQLVLDQPAPQCGDGVVDAGEECDGSAPDGFICTNQCILEEVIIEPEILSYGYASLLGVEEVPPVDEDGTGTGVFWLDDQDDLHYEFTVTGLTGPVVSAHFHGPADRAQSADTLYDITSSFNGNHAEGTWENLSQDSIDYLLSDQVYVNLHTEAYPDGELRSQVHMGDVGIIQLRDEYEVPEVDGTAVGTGFAKWLGESGNLWFHLTVDGLSGPIASAHFHGPADNSENADAIFDISFFIDGQHIEGDWNGVSLENRSYLVNEMAYINIHTSANPTGELRGQIIGLPSPPVNLGQLVINEVYADVDSEHGEEGANEWIELYNNGNTTVNLQDWIIDDSEESPDIIQEEVMVAPGEFALITQATSTFEVYWSELIPNGTHLITLGSPIGSGLANSGDALLLKSGDGIIDAMSYGNDDSILDLPVAAAGQSLSRQPNGKDTNTVADWVVLDEPTPGF